MLYKNISHSVKTFYGVTFQPGETKEVPGYINNNTMIVVDASKLKANVKQSIPSPKKQEKSSEKTSVTPEVKPEEKSDDKDSNSKSSSSKD